MKFLNLFFKLLVTFVGIGVFCHSAVKFLEPYGLLNWVTVVICILVAFFIALCIAERSGELEI